MERARALKSRQSRAGVFSGLDKLCDLGHIPEFPFPQLSKRDLSTQQIFECLLCAQSSAGAGDTAKNKTDRIPALIQQISTFQIRWSGKVSLRR